jgi:protein-tyrosine phosphatase
MKSILFVCLGNICRSPLADGIANKIAREQGLELYIDSAGTAQWHVDEPPCGNAIKVAAQNGIDISGLRARTLHRKDPETFEYIVAMDKQNRKDLESLGYKNVYLIGDYGGYGGADVPDPYFFDGFSGFEKVYDMLDTAVRDFLKKEGLWR